MNHSMNLGYPIFCSASWYQPQCTSTNDIAKQYYYNNMRLAEGSVFITDYQSQGRGRWGTAWVGEPAKNLTFSLVLHPFFLTLQDAFSLYVITSLALYNALSSYVLEGIFIKWPNDLYYYNKKLGGILIENTTNTLKNKIQSTIVGVGLNVNQEVFPVEQVTSLKLICRYSFDLSQLLHIILTQLGIYYVTLQDRGISWLLDTYMEKLYWRGVQHIFKDSKGYFQGIIKQVDSLGRLVISKGTEEVTYHDNKEIIFIN